MIWEGSARESRPQHITSFSSFYVYRLHLSAFSVRNVRRSATRSFCNSLCVRQILSLFAKPVLPPYVLQAEEERKRKEEQEQRDHEEYLKMKVFFSVDEEGHDAADVEEDVS